MEAKDRPDHQLTLAQLLKMLLADGLITEDMAQATSAQAPVRGDKRHPLEVIAAREWPYGNDERRKLTLEALVQWLAQKTDLPYLRIDPLSIDVHAITQVIPYAYAVRAGVLPVAVSDSEVSIATAQPYVRDWEAELQPVLKKRIRRVLTNPKDIERYQVEFYALARSVKASQDEREGRMPGAVRNLEQLMELGRAGKLDANDQHVINIVDWLLQYAFDQRASDIHLEPRREQGNIRFRIDGVMHEVYQVPDTVMAAVISRIKILGRMDVAEKRRPQDGRIKTRNPDGKEVELRVASLPTAFGEKLVLRIFDPEVLLRDFSELGFDQAESTLWPQMLKQPNGIILVTGPTGSGKTTTLYSSLKQLATPQVNVCTIEDPIELVEPSFNQMQVQTNIDLNFADGVRALLRQDPDIIMVGEIRDLETAEVAIQAALTGHLVLSSLHTNDAPSAITRMIELGVPAYLLRATVLGVLAQRLLRRLCTHCKHAVEISDERWAEISCGWPLAKPAEIYEPQGCLECRETGYRGRIGIYEILELGDELKAQIGEALDTQNLREAAVKLGMQPLRIAGAAKIAAGHTSIEEVLRTSPPPQSQAPAG